MCEQKYEPSVESDMSPHNLVFASFRFAPFPLLLDRLQKCIDIHDQGFVWIIDIDEKEVSVNNLVLGYECDAVGNRKSFCSRYSNKSGCCFEFKCNEYGEVFADVWGSIKTVLEHEYGCGRKAPDAVIIRSNNVLYVSATDRRDAKKSQAVGKEEVVLKLVYVKGFLWNSYVSGVIRCSDVVEFIRELYGGFKGHISVIDRDEVTLLLHLLSGLSVSVASFVKLLEIHPRFKVIGRCADQDSQGVWFWNPDESYPMDLKKMISDLCVKTIPYNEEIKLVDTYRIIKAYEERNADFWFGTITIKHMILDLKKRYNHKKVLDINCELILVSVLIMGLGASSVVIRRIYGLNNNTVFIKRDAEFQPLYVRDLIENRGILHGIASGLKKHVALCCITSVDMPSVVWDSESMCMTVKIGKNESSEIIDNMSEHFIDIDLYMLSSEMDANGMIVLGKETVFKVLDDIAG